ncbi:MAG: DUF1611 domain-containing protein [Gemmatimonadetes bacterium]|nr:DUF1611 domain-containing protein [Gemmatimonadota bacterium]
MRTLATYRYVVLAEAHFGPESSKTANSAIRYLPDRVVAVLDSCSDRRTVQEVLGFGGDIPIVRSFQEGLAHGPTALLIGIAPMGGQLPAAWRPVLEAAIDAGLDIVSGLHFALGDDSSLSSRAEARGVTLLDLRREPEQLPISSGRAGLTECFTVLTVGTDCNIGKMTAALQIRAALTAEGLSVGFVATGQTGILIEGRGIAVDAVKADFIGGAAEQLVLEAAEGNDVVLVEGQGSLVHPGYAGVTLGLLHGAMPDAMILCHQPSRLFVNGGVGPSGWMCLPSLSDAIRINESAIAPLRRTRVIGISLNTFDLSEDEALAAIAAAESETGLPATDPVRFSAAPLARAVLSACERSRAVVSN